MLVPLLLLILLGIDWASGYAIAGYVMHHGVNPYGYAFWQSTGPFICLFVIEALRRDIQFKLNGLAYAIGCGIFGIAIPNLLIYIASRYVDSGILTVLANTAPLFTYPLALFFAQEKYHIKRLSMLLIGVAGMIILSAPIQKGINVNFSNVWLYLSLLIPFCYAFTAVFIARFRPKGGGSSLNYSMWMLLVAVLCLTPLMIVNKGYYPLRVFDLNSWLIGLEIVLSTFGYVLLFVIIKRVGPVYYTLVNAVAALMGLVYSVLLFNRSFNYIVYFATGLIIIAITGLTYLQSKIQTKVKRND